MSTNSCPEDHFLDPVTSTCINCFYICHPIHKTDPECKKYCPEYKLPKHTEYFQELLVPPSSQQPLSGDGISKPSEQNIAVLVVLALLLFSMFFMLSLIRKRYKPDQNINILRTSASVKRSIRISSWQKRHNCCIYNLTDISENPAMSHIAIDIHVAHTSPQSINHSPKSQSKYVVFGDTKLTDSGRGSSDNQSDHVDELSSLRLDHDDTRAGSKGITIPSNNTYKMSIQVSNEELTSPKVPLHTLQVPDFNLEISDSMHNGISEPLELNTYYTNGSTKNKKHKEHHGENHLSESVNDMDHGVNDAAAESEDQDSLSLHLVSCDQPISHPASDPLSNNGDANDVWDQVMELYELIEGKLAQFPWIVGCMISSDRLEVIMDCLKTHLKLDEAHDKLCQEIPEQLRQYLEISTEGPSIELCCGKYGAGCPVFDLEENGTRGRTATVTLIGHNENDNYAFTVGHVLERHQHNCEIVCNCQTKMVSSVRFLSSCHR